MSHDPPMFHFSNNPRAISQFTEFEFFTATAEDSLLIIIDFNACIIVSRLR